MSDLPDLDAIVQRFNAACLAYDGAIDAIQARDGARHDAQLVQAARDVGSVLELAVLRLVGLAEPGRFSELRRVPFPDLIRHPQMLRLPWYSDDLRRRLETWKTMRNRAEHPPIRIPSLRPLLEALGGTRRFLIDAFGEIADLADPERPVSSATRTAAAPSPQVVDDTHREVGPIAWVEVRFDDGLLRLRPAHDRPVPLRKEDVRRKLTLLSRALVDAGEDPSGVIPVAVAGALGADRRLFVEAGWITEGEGRLRFDDPRLPAILVGLALARGEKGAGPLRRTIGGRRAWAEAAWAATAAGDPAPVWLRPLTESSDLDLLPDRVITACAAMAGSATRGGAVPDALLDITARAAGAALVWLAPLPAPHQHGAPSSDANWNAWQLDRTAWHRALLDLASGTERIGVVKPPLDWRRPGGALGRLVTALGLTPPLSDDAAPVVLGLGRPWSGGRSLPLDGHFFDLLFSLTAGIFGRVDSPFVEKWLTQSGIPALRRSDPRGADRLLVVGGASHLGNVLLRAEVLLPEWCEAWERFASNEPVHEAASTWVHGATMVATSGVADDQAEEFLLRHAPEKLCRLGAWEAARARLEETLKPDALPSRPTDRQVRYAGRLFSLTELPPARLREKIETWSTGPRLPWQILLAAGAPHDAIARWCIDKLRQKQREAPALDGPPGILATGAEVLAAGPWQFAFNQAQEAFYWLLAHGDEGAVTVLADACFGVENSERYDPPMGKMLNLTVPLSQVLWGEVIARREGRAALYTRVERGGQIGHLHFQPGGPPWIAEQLWTALALHLINPVVEQGRAATDEEAGEALRLMSAFELWRSGLLPPASTSGRPTWGDAAARSPKTVLIFCGALHGIDVVEPLTGLLGGVVHDALAHEENLLTGLGEALNLVCRRSESPPEALLALAATTRVARQLAKDDTQAFWETLLRHRGLAEVARLVDELALPDLGLGLFDALASVTPEALDAWQARPDLLRAVLVRSTEGHFQPPPSFHERAWVTPRRPSDIRDLNEIPAGDWLDALIAQSRHWPRDERDTFLRDLAQRSRHAEVRRRCLGALVDDGGAA